MKRLKVSTAIMLTFLLLFSGLFPGGGLVQAAPVVDNTPTDTIIYYEGSSAIVLAPDIQITDDASVSYADGYIQYEVENATPGDILKLNLDEPVSIPGVGILSLETDGRTLLLDGKAIGSLSSILDGEGKALRIDFSALLDNGDFNQGDPRQSDYIQGWTIRNSNDIAGYPNQVWLGPEKATKTQGNVYDQVYSNNDGSYTVVGVDETYRYITDVNYANSAEGPRREGQEMLLGNYSTNQISYIRRITNNDGNNFLELGYRNGGVTSSRNNLHGTAFGPEAISDEFTAEAGEKLAFDWTAFKDSSGDDYEVYGFLVQTDGSGTMNLEDFPHYEMMYSRGGTKPGWETVNREIPADGTYRFRFVAGSYDKTGGNLLGATLSVDNVRVLSNSINQQVAQVVATLITYEHDPNTPVSGTTEKNIKITVQNGEGDVSQSLADVKLELREALKLIQVDLEDTTPDTVTLTFNMPVAEPLDLTGLLVGGKQVEEIISVDGDKVIVKLESPVDPGPFKVSYDADQATSPVSAHGDPDNQLASISADPGFDGTLTITPLELEKASTDPSNPNQVKLNFNKPVDGDLVPGETIPGLTVGGKPVKYVGKNADGTQIIVELDEPYQDGEQVSYDGSEGNLADAKYPSNQLDTIPPTNISTVNGKLEELEFNNGGSSLDLKPAFNPDQNEGYEAVVPNDVDSIGITAEAFDTEETFAKVIVNGKEIDPANGGWDNLELEEGKNTIIIKVYDKETGTELESYSIDVWRATSKLSDLEISLGTLTPEFTPEVNQYEINVPNKVTEIDFQPTLIDPLSKVEISLNGGEKFVVDNEKDYKNLPLKVGVNTIVFTITDRLGESREYTVTINRAAPASLELISGGNALPLTPAFDPDKLDGYKATVANNVASFELSLEAFNTEDTFAKVSVNGKEFDPANGGWDSLPLKEGNNTIKVTVYDKQTGEALKTYTIDVWRTTSKLADLEIPGNTLNPEFDPEVNQYQINVPNRTREIDLQFIPVDPEAKIELSLNGGEKFVVDSAEDYKNLPLSVGKNTVVLTITDRFGEIKEYTITINRARANDGGVNLPRPGGGSGTTERIEVDLVVGGDRQSTKVEIERTVDSDGRISDQITLNPDKAQEAANKAKAEGEKVVSIVVPDAADEVSEVRVDIPLNSGRILHDNGIDLELITENGTVLIPNASLKDLTSSFYFRLVPVKETSEQNAIQSRAREDQNVRNIAGNASIDVIGRSVQIETDLNNRPLAITLPLKDVEIPQNAEQRKALFDSLKIYVEHADGRIEIVEAEAVLMNDGTYGLLVNLDGFDGDGLSTLSILRFTEEVSGYHERYIVGYEDGTFRPEQSISRAEVATVLARTVAAEANLEGGASFHDVSSSHWASEYIVRASAAGLISGYPEGDFRPEGKITRAELAAIVFNYLDLQEADGTAFPDVADSHWASGIIAAVEESGMMSGYPDGTFQPARELSRAEAVAVFNRLFSRGPLYGVSSASWSDVTESHWAFHYIEEASTDHAYVIRPEGGETLVTE